MGYDLLKGKIVMRYSASNLVRLLTYVLALLGCAGLLPATARADIYVPDWTGEKISKFTPAGITINSSFITGLHDPTGIIVNGTDLYVANNSTNTIGKYNALTGATINATLVSGLGSPNCMAISGSNIFVANQGTGTIGEYTTSGAAVNSALITGLSGPTTLAISGTNLFVVNYNAGTIGEYTTSGAVVNASLITGLGTFNVNGGIAISGSSLFVLSGPDTNGTLSQYSLSGTLVNPAVITGLTGGHWAMAFSGSGTDLYIMSNGHQSVLQYTTTGTLVNANLITGLGVPTNIALDVPEPASISLLALCGAPLLLRRRRSKSNPDVL